MALLAVSGLLIKVRHRAPGPGAAAAPAISLQARATGGPPPRSLFVTPPRAGGGPAAAPSPGSTWFHMPLRASGSPGVQARAAWDQAHDLLKEGVSLAAGGEADIELVEPDFIQPWVGNQHRAREDAAIDGCTFADKNATLEPKAPTDFAWHLGDRFSQLAAARAAAAGGRGVRIAHLDTGYDPTHRTFPSQRIELGLQRNFIDADFPNDATDRAAPGMLKNPGHGTGTLSILAAGRFTWKDQTYDFDDDLGGAPQARIVPLRVGNSVVQIKTSSVAEAIAYVANLCDDPATRIDVLSMSMGGVASAAWADAVNRAYEAGVVLVTAAGNNFSAGLFGVPTHFIVYPARFRRVIAACGVMASGEPYYGLPFRTMQGNWGPDSKMATAIAAFTPNIPWARAGCAAIVDMDGAGTSAATPQVAAAAALYISRHRAALSQYAEPWMRVEAVRAALFGAAAAPDADRAAKLGRGVLRAADALNLAPANTAALRQSEPASASFAFLRVLTGLGIAAPAPSPMHELEALQLVQRWSRSDQPNPFDDLLASLDSDPRAPEGRVRQLAEALEAHPEASGSLRDWLNDALGRNRRGSVQVLEVDGEPPRPGEPPPPPAAPPSPKPSGVPAPAHRLLRGYTMDPGFAASLETVSVGEATFRVPWEPLTPGPCGEYIEVIDIDPASGMAYPPVDLNDPHILAQNGLAPSEGSPQFHQQMVYAVARLTIDSFERALGRKALWSPGPPPAGTPNEYDGHFVQQLRIYPHALREANAYYSRQKVALLMGYFESRGAESRAGRGAPAPRVFTCLSHDIVAHETTHALLDGMHRRFLVASNPDVRAFHEAFADIVALLQRLTFPELLRHQIASSRGDIRDQPTVLGSLATQFGRATGLRGGLREAIGRWDGERWVRYQPSVDDYEASEECHARGAVLVAAVFDAFLAIYERRTADLLRLASGGSGVLAAGAVHPDLVNRLADEATKTARHVLTMCVRALDYCPPTDLTFGEYLRAMLTADFDIVPDDDLRYRVAFVEAFRRRGIYPRDVQALGVDSLLWRGPRDDPPPESLAGVLEHIRPRIEEYIRARDREQLFRVQRSIRGMLHGVLESALSEPDGAELPRYLGIRPDLPFEVHTARIAFRTMPSGDVLPQLLVGLLQVDRPDKPRKDGAPGGMPIDPTGIATDARMAVEGGCTLVADLGSLDVSYCIRKRFGSEGRLEQQRAFALRSLGSLRGVYLGGGLLDDQDEPFAAMHRGE